jgi:hypothetical protein
VFILEFYILIVIIYNLELPNKAKDPNKYNIYYLHVAFISLQLINKRKLIIKIPIYSLEDIF